MATTLREASIEDAPALASLTSELGYPSALEEIEKRITSISTDPQQKIFVAVSKVVMGWIQISLRESVESGAFGEIQGLIVSSSARGRGIGTDLVKIAEEWVKEQGCKKVRVRTNVVREEAREFYKRQGYHQTKRQEVFDKTL